jgi:phospholipid/cholesterol/gamma-HCH transport system substrate-binding protein
MKRAINAHLGDFIAIIALFAIAMGITVYILGNERLRFPFVEEQPYKVKVELQNAQAVQPGQGQTVRVAGVRVGDIGDVNVENGKAVVTMELDPKYKHLLHANATALLRSKTGLKDMFLEVDPGDGPMLKKGATIQATNTAPDVNPDEFLSALDADTRDYLKLLISGAGKGLAGRGQDLRAVFKRFGPIHRDLAKLSTAVARRRTNLARLVNRYGLLTKELSGKDSDLTRLVTQSNQVFEAFASQNGNVSQFVAKLPSSLRQTQTTLAKVDTLGHRLGPALDALRPPFRKLDAANKAVLPLALEGTPILRDQVRPFTRISIPYNAKIGSASKNLATASPDLARSFKGLNRLFNIGAYNPGGTEGLTGDLAKDRARNEGYLYWLGWVVQTGTSLFSQQDAQGPFRRATLGGINCAVLGVAGQKAGLPPAQITFLQTTFQGIGACN